MGKYLIQATYSQEGLKGLLKEGAANRRAVVEKTVQAVGGTMEGLFWALGQTDIFVFVDVPDQSGAIALSMIVNATGAVHASVTVLLTAVDMDRAISIAGAASSAFHVPGQ
jgi:uncharacterized protein with GYD domain